jgi:T-complex protein 1 subunit gamma
MINKDVTHSAMRRRIVNPRIILLDCNLEYKKPANVIIQLDKAPDFEQIMREEEEAVKQMVMDIVKHKPDLVITEKGISDEAQHWFVKYNITALRRVRKSINDRIAKATGATIVNRPEELKESDVGTKCGLFDIRKIGDEYWTFITDCKDPKVSTILLRGATKDTLAEIERNLNDAICVAKNVYFEPRLCPGGGASEMAMATKLMEKSKSIAGIEQYPYHSIALALEVIPRTLIQNCGADILRTITSLRAKHATGGNHTWGIDGDKGVLVDMHKYGIWEPYLVKAQTIKTSIEAACMLLRIDDIVSGLRKKDKEGPSVTTTGQPEDSEP